MSSIARWSYKNTATVKPFLSVDGMTGKKVYGTEYDIACGFIDNVRQESVGVGTGSGVVGLSRDFVNKIYTEDARPKRGDMIKTSYSDFVEIKNRTVYEMAAFNVTDDFLLET